MNPQSNQDMDRYVRIGVNRYKVDTLENNWNEERFDRQYIKQLKPTLSEHGYAYQTTYSDMISNVRRSDDQQEKANLAKKATGVVAHPGHQVELSIKGWRPFYGTDYTISYIDHRLAKNISNI